MMNKILYCPNVIYYLLRKRKCFSNQTGDSLSHCTVKSFNMICFSTFFSNSTMSFGRKNFLISRPKICISYCVFFVNFWQRIPQPLRSLTIPTSYIYSNYFPCIFIHCQPNPLFILFLSDKRPHFITFNCQTTSSCSGYCHFSWYIFIFLIYILLQPSFRNTRYSCYSCKRYFF